MCLVMLTQPEKLSWACRTRERTARTHTAMSDIRASLEELRWYKRMVFKPPAQLAAFARQDALQQEAVVPAPVT